MKTDAYVLTEGDDADTLAGSSNNVISLFRPAAAEPIMIGEEFDLIVADLAVRMRGQFFLPRVMALTAREDELSGRF